MISKDSKAEQFDIKIAKDGFLEVLKIFYQEIQSKCKK